MGRIVKTDPINIALVFLVFMNTLAVVQFMMWYRHVLFYVTLRSM